MPADDSDMDDAPYPIPKRARTPSGSHSDSGELVGDPHHIIHKQTKVVHKNDSQPSPPSHVTFHIQEQSGARVFNNPKHITDAIVKSHFAKYFTSGDPEVKGAGRTLAITLRECDLEKLSKPMEQLNTFGPWKVKCRRVGPVDTSLYTFGIVGPIDLAISTEVFFSSLNIMELNKERPLDPCEIMDVYRLPSKFPGPNEPPKSQTIRIRFKGPLPVRVKCDGMSLQVREYHFPVWRCFICTQFGHGSATCRNSVRCTMCSGNHRFRAEDGSRCEKPPFCYLCLGNHRPTSHACPLYHKALDIHKKGIANNTPRSEVNRQLRGLPLTFRQELRTAYQSNVQAAPPPQAATPSRTFLSPSLKAKSMSRLPSGIPGIQTSNRFTLLTPRDIEEEAQDSIPQHHLSVSTHPSSYAAAVVHHPPPSRRRSPPHPRPRSTSHQTVDWSAEEELVEINSQEEPTVTSPHPSPNHDSHPRVVYGSSRPHSPATPTAPTLDLTSLLRIIFDAISAYLQGVPPHDICEQLLPRILGLLPSQ